MARIHNDPSEGADPVRYVKLEVRLPVELVFLMDQAAYAEETPLWKWLWRELSRSAVNTDYFEKHFLEDE